jgi:geranylgeranyl reductase family protein
LCQPRRVDDNPSSGSPVSHDYELAVVGAGPAGATAALHFARALAGTGGRVALLEKAKLPRYKTCGGGVVGRALRELPRDVRIPVEHECRAAVAAFLESGASFRVEREAPIVSMTMRAELDRELAEAAVRSDAELLAPCELLGLAQDADGVDLETSRGRIRAAWVIGADGVLSTVARQAGWTSAPRTIPALEVEVRVPAEVHARFAGVARFDFEALEAGYGWVFPKREHLSCGVLTMRRGAGGLREALDRYLERVGVAPVLSAERHGYLIPVRPRRGGFARGRVLLAGDAAGFADALTGEGISIAMQSVASRPVRSRQLRVPQARARAPLPPRARARAPPRAADRARARLGRVRVPADPPRALRAPRRGPVRRPDGRLRGRADLPVARRAAGELARAPVADGAPGGAESAPSLVAKPAATARTAHALHPARLGEGSERRVLPGIPVASPRPAEPARRTSWWRGPATTKTASVP